MIDEKLKAGNVINLDLDTPIYKYIPFKYLKLMGTWYWILTVSNACDLRVEKIKMSNVKSNLAKI